MVIAMTDVTVQDVGTLSKLINDYGPFIVILSVFLMIFIALIIYMVKANKQAITTTQDMNKQLIDSLLNELNAKTEELKRKPEKDYNEKNIIDIFVKLNKTLKTVCESTMEKTNSDRTAIYVFHNGTQASHGLPFFKLSCISEWVSKSSNLNVKMREHTALPLNLFDSLIDGLYDNSEYRITEGVNTDPGDIIFLKDTKIKDCFCIPIYDDDNSMMGFVFNGYNTLNPEIDVEKEKQALQELANMAKPVIEFSKFQEYQSNQLKEKE